MVITSVKFLGNNLLLLDVIWRLIVGVESEALNKIRFYNEVANNCVGVLLLTLIQLLSWNYLLIIILLLFICGMNLFTKFWCCVVIYFWIVVDYEGWLREKWFVLLKFAHMWTMELKLDPDYLGSESFMHMHWGGIIMYLYVNVYLAKIHP